VPNQGFSKRAKVISLVTHVTCYHRIFGVKEYCEASPGRAPYVELGSDKSGPTSLSIDRRAYVTCMLLHVIHLFKSSKMSG